MNAHVVQTHRRVFIPRKQFRQQRKRDWILRPVADGEDYSRHHQLGKRVCVCSHNRSSGPNCRSSG